MLLFYLYILGNLEIQKRFLDLAIYLWLFALYIQDDKYAGIQVKHKELDLNPQYSIYHSIHHLWVQEFSEDSKLHILDVDMANINVHL